ncbi:FHA domain-containing protein, partial [Vibrio parahaemolyticus]|nr:FHA domain-containing protein [Vibrio parahaemolyticus]
MPEGGGSVGRAPSCTLSLTDHNRFISGTHCLISVYGDTFYISDVSTNGTMVNGNKILKNQPISIVDGDVVSLGQYEIGVALEHISAVQDIAADIAPERVSNDPLVNLGEAVVEEEEKVGSLEDLFMETKQDGVNTDDPIAHLKFSMQREDDYLIRDVEKPEPAPAKTIENTRQVVDDSFSIHSEFDIPNLIP